LPKKNSKLEKTLWLDQVIYSRKYLEKNKH
jgi:hypothetical protein